MQFKTHVFKKSLKNSLELSVRSILIKKFISDDIQSLTAISNQDLTTRKSFVIFLISFWNSPTAQYIFYRKNVGYSKIILA